jgi:hypothetical protein
VVSFRKCLNMIYAAAELDAAPVPSMKLPTTG